MKKRIFCQFVSKRSILCDIRCQYHVSLCHIAYSGLVECQSSWTITDNSMQDFACVVAIVEHIVIIVDSTMGFSAAIEIY